MRVRMTLSVLAGALALATSAIAAGPFTLTSASFKDGGMLGVKFAGNIAGNANCPGQNISPALAWSNPPEGTRSFALTMVDPEGAAGLGVNHWVAYGVAPTVTGFAEGEVSQPGPKYVGGKSSRGIGSYAGPCPPPSAPHHYGFVVIATDLAPDALPPGLTREELIAKLQGHAKGAAGMVGLFQHQ